jgi:predicted DNA binding CopG/RHH family protein
MKAKRIVPKFKSEAQEAKWWDHNRRMVEQNFLQAMAEGSIHRGMALKLTRQARASKNITIRIPVDDINRARRLSESKGIGYQTLMKMLLHEALAREEAAGVKRSKRSREF